MIEIPHSFLRLYLGGVSGYWSALNDLPPFPSEAIPFKFFKNEIDMATNLKERVILEIGLGAIAHLNGMNLERYDGSHGSWENEDMKLLIAQMQTYLTKLTPRDLKRLAPFVSFSEMQLSEWREKIKPGILQMLTEEGIEP